jgi:hypothetical protein
MAESTGMLSGAAPLSYNRRRANRQEPWLLMKDIIEHVEAYRRRAIHDAEAHLISAEWHRAADMRYGLGSIALSTLVSTTVFAGLSKRFTLESGSGPDSTNLGWAVGIAIILVAAPILTAFYKFMHNAEDAASHNASAERYDRLVRQYDLFLMEFADADSTKRDQAVKALRDLDAQYAVAREKNITLTDAAKRRARTLVSTSDRLKAIGAGDNSIEPPNPFQLRPPPR